MKKAFLIYIIFIAVLITGYIKNIIRLTECDFVPPYKAEAIRIAAIPLGFGAIIGYIKIKDGPATN